jgi:hypothetical protein
MLRNLRHLFLNDDQFEKIDPSYCNYKVFEEVLGVNVTLACSLEDFFRRRAHKPGQEIVYISAD